MPNSLYQRLTDAILGLLFPDRCAGCGLVGKLFCPSCQAKLKPYPLEKQSFRAKESEKLLLDDFTVAFIFEGALREALHQLKYKKIRRMALPLGDLLAKHLAKHPLPADAILPVPLHPKRLKERGFNQSALLGEQLAQHRKVPLLPTGLERTRDTAHQVSLNAQERQANIKDAFSWQASKSPPARVLLLDDVLTTGATLQACAQALRAAGAQEVRALALGRSRPDR